VLHFCFPELLFDSIEVELCEPGAAVICQ